MIKVALLLLLIVTALAQTSSIQITPSNPTLFSSCNYLVSYYTFVNMPNTATFTLNFGSSYITVPNGTLNVSATISSNAVTGATGTCSNSVCTLKLNRNVAAGNSAVFTIGTLVNPYFLRNQSIPAIITFNSTYSESSTYVIPSEKYTTMAIVSNSLQQSDYGVGNTGVNYVFNFSIPMSPANVQLSITIPSQIEMGTIQTSLIFYGTPISVIPVFVDKIIVLSFNTNPTNSTDPKGFILLNISGLTNPKSMGNSSSFILQILIPNLPNTTIACSGCAVAQLSSFLFAQSIVPGNIQTLNIFSSNSLIGQANNISVYSNLLASIPPGGIYQVLLPSTIKPALPITCSNGYGFTFINNNPPSCSYNQTNNAIYTNNFAFTGSGNVLILFSIINPPDTTPANLYFQTFDANSNMIGNSSKSYALSATPQVLPFTATKTNNQVETSFNLTLSLTLGVALTSSNFIKVILPQASYNTSSITCSTVVNIQCNSSVDPMTGNLTVTLVPPCTQCSVGTVITFAINNLNNPSYINNYSQSIIVQTATTSGLFETNSISVNLIPSSLTISNYARSGSNTVGSAYSMSFTYTISNYITLNGGILLINFNPNDTYINPVYTTSTKTYTYPTEITVTDNLNNKYPNSITYYTSNNPNSLQQIAIDICGPIFCSTSLTISGLRKGFNALSSLTQTIQITTGFGDSVSSSTFNAVQFNVAKTMSNLKLNLSNSVTSLTSNYVIDFISSNTPFQSGLVFTFSTLHTINGGCFLTHNSTIFDGVFNCQVTSNNSVSLTYTGDITLMMIDIIDYTLSVINVTNPVSTVPLAYSLSTQYNSVANQQFSTTYSIQTPFPLSFLYSKSNNTFGQNSILNITVVSNYPAFNEIKLNIPSPLMTVLASSSYQSTMINNAYQINQIYSLTNQSVTISIVNPNSTNTVGNIAFSMFSAGYLSATGNISILTVVPMFLGISATTTSRVVGDTTNLTVAFNRVNSYSSQVNFLFSFTSELYNYTNAQYNNAPISFPITIPIGLTSITITNLRNILRIPQTTPVNSITAWTVDSLGYTVAVSSYAPTTLLPNKPAMGISCAITRTNTAINGVGAININYTPRFPTPISIMTLIMPSNQASIVSPACTLQGSTNGATCSILFSNSTTLSLTYTNQTVTSLTNVLNIEPNNNLMSIYMYTSNNQLVQYLNGTISPTIQYNQLSVSGNINSTSVATNTRLFLNITSPSPIDIGSKIVINLPPNTFLRIPSLVSQDCTYSINGVNFTGCQYSNSGNWLIQTNLSLQGSSQIPANTSILLSLFTTNAWSVSSFSALALSMFISNPSDNYVAQGSISLANIYGGVPNLAAIPSNNISLTQTSNIANSNNVVSFSFTLSVPITTGSTLILYLPKSIYYLSPANAATTSNLQAQNENLTYYTLNFSLTCTQTSPICNSANSQYSFTLNLQNNPYVKIASDQFSFQVLLGSNPVTSQSNLPTSNFVPQTMSSSSSISRSKTTAFSPTNITISVPNPVNVNSYTLVISPLAKATTALPLLYLPNSAVLQTQPLTYQLNSSNHLIINVIGVTGSTSNVIVAGQNNLLVSSTPQIYGVTILDTNYVYFTGQISTTDSLTPYSQGINLQRIVTTVGVNTNVYLYGTLPATIPILAVTFNGNNFTVPGSTFNISLGTITNSKNVSDVSTFPVILRNTDYIGYSNTLSLLPSLTTQNFSSLLAFNLPSTVTVNSNFSLHISLNQTSLTYVSVYTPVFFKSLNRCCIDSTCSQTFIQSCKNVQQSSNNFIELWLTTSQTLTNITFVVTSIDFQTNFLNQPITIVSALPTSSLTLSANLVIAAANITSSLSLQSWKVNQINTYTLNVQPIAKVGFLSILLPNYISSQLNSNSNANYSLTVNGTVTQTSLKNTNGQSTITVPISFSAGNIQLLMTSILNPIDNTPYNIVIQQASDQEFTNIFGYSSIGIEMKQFDTITLSSAIRVVTKVNSPTNLIIQIDSPYNNNQLIINFPLSQITTTQTCTIMINQTHSAPCQVLNSTSIMTTSYTGTNRYTISGLQNQKFYDAKTTSDLIKAQIGTPYLRATSTPTTSTSISPQLTLGSIIVNSMSSLNNLQLTTTALTYNITIQNTNNINGFILQFASYYYIFSPTLACTINDVKVACVPIDNETIFLPYPNPTTNSLIVKITNIVNFIKPANWTLKSVQTTLASNGQTIASFSDVDLYYNDGSSQAPLAPSTMKMRVILPFNHVQSSPVVFSAIIDSQYSSYLPLNLFNINFTTQDNNCKLLASKFATTLSISCTFGLSSNYNMQLQLYHTKFPTLPLSVGTSKLFIYPSPSGQCSNQMCDSCSVVNGQQYCFNCRQGLYSSNGQCTEQCSSGSFPYESTNICQPCSPTCSNCFGLYSTNCLSCKDTALTLSSGTCVNTCPDGTFSYIGYCVNGQQCTTTSGCRLCSNTGFCYQCLPDYRGPPNCKYVNVMPPTIMIYILAPFAILGLASIVFAAAKCLGAESILSQAIFSLSFVQLFAWACTVPITPSVASGMVLISFFTLRIIISIVSYETFYKKNLGELSQKLLEEQSQKQIQQKNKEEQGKEQKNELDNWKTKLVRFIAHFNGPDSYQLLKSKIAEPVLSVNHSLSIQIIFIANRWLVCFLMFYLLSVATIGDSIIMPLFNIMNATLLCICRLLTVQKVRKCLTCFK